MNIDLELALSLLAQDPTNLVPWSAIITAFNDKVSTGRTINGKSLLSDIILDLDSVDFINQGTTTKVLHGNAAGAPSWGFIVTNDLTDLNVTYGKIQNITATSRILGRITAGAGIIEELTGAQATSLLDLFGTTSTTKGLVPGSNSVGSTYFLNGAGAWSVPLSTDHATLSHLTYATSGHTGFEPSIIAGTTSQYFRGDKTWQVVAQGVQGTQGIQGIQSIQGIQGIQGIQSIQGIQGIQGIQVQGTQGIQGIYGTQGIQGKQGTQGIQGIQGDAASMQGIQGIQGTQGVTVQGQTGSQGLTGSGGGTGQQGTQGIQGIQGIQSIQGLQGTTGQINVTSGTGNPSGGSDGDVYFQYDA